MQFWKFNRCKSKPHLFNSLDNLRRKGGTETKTQARRNDKGNWNTTNLTFQRNYFAYFYINTFENPDIKFQGKHSLQKLTSSEIQSSKRTNLDTTYQRHLVSQGNSAKSSMSMGAFLVFFKGPFEYV